MLIQNKWRTHLQEHKRVFIVAAVVLLFLEIEIFALAALKSGPQTQLQIVDGRGHILFSVKGNHLSRQDKAKFEQTFGPLSNYQVTLETRDRPFPFRAWLAAAVGLPVGAVLLLGFFVRAYEALFIKADKAEKLLEEEQPPTGRLNSILSRISRFNIFVLGGLVLVFAVGLWALPYMLVEAGRHSIDFIARYKGIVLSAVFIFLGLVVWIIYLRYRLAAKALEGQVAVEKYRLQLEILGRSDNIPRLENPETGLLDPPSGREPDVQNQSDPLRTEHRQKEKGASTP